MEAISNNDIILEKSTSSLLSYSVKYIHLDKLYEGVIDTKFLDSHKILNDEDLINKIFNGTKQYIFLSEVGLNTIELRIKLNVNFGDNLNHIRSLSIPLNLKQLDNQDELKSFKINQKLKKLETSMNSFDELNTNSFSDFLNSFLCS